MVARLEEEGTLGPGPVRDALLALPREVLMPQAYVRRSGPGEEVPRWDLLDWSAPLDRPELLGLLYGGASVLVQHDGEPLLGRARGTRSGASITSMSTVMGLTVELLEELDLRPGLRVLDVGTGAGVTAAVACQVCSDQGVVTLDRASTSPTRPPPAWPISASGRRWCAVRANRASRAGSSIGFSCRTRWSACQRPWWSNSRQAPSCWRT